MSMRGLPECSYASFAISPMPTKLVQEELKEGKDEEGDAAPKQIEDGEEKKKE